MLSKFKYAKRPGIFFGKKSSFSYQSSEGLYFISYLFDEIWAEKTLKIAVKNPCYVLDRGSNYRKIFFGKDNGLLNKGIIFIIVL